MYQDINYDVRAPVAIITMNRPEALNAINAELRADLNAAWEQFREDEEAWGLVGLLHDFDYERWPDPPDHPLQGAAILAEREGIFAGISSGAAVAGMLKVAHSEDLADRDLLAILPDTGERYLTSPLFEGITEEGDTI